MSPELVVLFPGDQTVPPVIPHHDRDPCVEPPGRLHLLHVHQEPAIPAYRKDTPVRVDEVSRNSAGEGESHRAEPVRDQARGRHVAVVIASHPHLVGPHVREQDVLASQNLPYVPEHLLRLDRTHGIIILPFRELGLHLPANGRLLGQVEAELTPLLPERVDPLVEHPHGVGQVTHDLDLQAVILVDLGGQEVDVDDPFF